MELVLSVFTGAGLLDRGFREEGFCVVSAGDILTGQDVCEFTAARHKFNGMLLGSPCQDFSKARRTAPTGYGLKMIEEGKRLIIEAEPEWFVWENVTGIPDVIIPGYTVQRFNLNAKECGVRQNRPRCFQFGSRDGSRLVVDRCVTNGPVEPCCLATEGKRTHRRTFADFCELQGLPRNFLSGSDLAQSLKYQLVGNGVPVPMARVLARAVQRRHVTKFALLCACDCGREVRPGQTLATAACRKRMQRRRDAAVTEPGSVTSGMSQGALL